MSQVPAAARALRVLRFLASQTDPVPLERIARAVGLPRSTAYHLIGTMIEEGFVTHLADEHRYGLGIAAFEVGSGYARQEPLQRLARRPLVALVDRTGHSAHLAVLHGRDVLYVLEERAPRRPPLVSDVGRPAPGGAHRQRARDPRRTAAGAGAGAVPRPGVVRAAAQPGADEPPRAPNVADGDAPARVRHRGRRGDSGLRQRGRRRAGPQRASGRGGGLHVSQ